MGTTTEELERLDADGVAADQLVWAAYFFSHPFSTWEQRQSFREALRDSGFTGIGTTNESSGDPYWHHWSHTIRPAIPAELLAADEIAARIARTHGVVYDEWTLFRNRENSDLHHRRMKPDSGLKTLTRSRSRGRLGSVTALPATGRSGSGAIPEHWRSPMPPRVRACASAAFTCGSSLLPSLG